MTSIPFIDADFIQDHTNFLVLTDSLADAFKSETMIVPLRHHHNFPNPGLSDTTLLLMPAWTPGVEGGVKIITVCPDNAQFDLPTIQGNYIYFDARNGVVRAIFDAKKLTSKRTAAASALASSMLSRPSSSSLLVVGTGTLAPELIQAHSSVRPIEKVLVWGRSFEKAKAICHHFQNSEFEIHPVQDIEEAIPQADIISCATFSNDPLIFGQLLRPGQHIDLVGSYQPHMREADDDTLLRSTIFVDNLEGALKETGDMVIPLKNNVITHEDIKGDLFSLCKTRRLYRQFEDEITLFKSVGHALEDLVAAGYYYNQFVNA